MPIPYISDLDNDTLLQEFTRSIARLRSLDRTAPAWTHDIRLMYHDYLADEVAARGLRIEKQTVVSNPSSNIKRQYASVAPE